MTLCNVHFNTWWSFNSQGKVVTVFRCDGHKFVVLVWFLITSATKITTIYLCLRKLCLKDWVPFCLNTVYIQMLIDYIHGHQWKTCWFSLVGRASNLVKPASNLSGNCDSHLIQCSLHRQVSTASRISIRSATFAQQSHMTDRLTNELSNSPLHLMRPMWLSNGDTKCSDRGRRDRSVCWRREWDPFWTTHFHSVTATLWHTHTHADAMR